MYSNYGNYNYNDFGVNSPTVTPAGMEQFLAGFLGVILIVCLIFCVCFVLQMVGTYKLLKKSGKSPVGAFIPIVGTYELLEATGMNLWWLVIISYASILCVVPILGIIAFVAVIIYYFIIYNSGLAKTFGRDSIGFKIGLFFLHPIFIFLLGISKEEYNGPKPEYELLFNKKPVGNVTNMSSNNVATNVPSNNNGSINPTSTSVNNNTFESNSSSADSNTVDSNDNNSTPNV